MAEKKIAWEPPKDLREIAASNAEQFRDFYGDDSDLLMSNGQGGPEPPTNVFITPFGIIPMEDESIIEFWTIHTNFPIDNNVIDVLEHIDGVEIIQVFSRYRMRIAVGKLFDFSTVRRDIENALCGSPTSSIPEEIKQAVIELKTKLTAHPYWGILVLPNGHIESIYSDKIDDSFMEKIDLMKATYEGVGGHFDYSSA